MHISAAELETTVMRAATGAGVVYGTALKSAKQPLRFPITVSMHDGDCNRIGKSRSTGCERFAVDDACNGIFLPKARYLSAILAGPSICDLLASGQNKIIARNLDVPILVVSLLAVRHLGVNARHSADDQPTATCANGRFVFAENQVSTWRHPEI